MLAVDVQEPLTPTLEPDGAKVPSMDADHADCAIALRSLANKRPRGHADVDLRDQSGSPSMLFLSFNAHYFECSDHDRRLVPRISVLKRSQAIFKQGIQCVQGVFEGRQFVAWRCPPYAL